MKKLVQINVVSNSGSTGRIMENIGKLAIAKGWQSHVAYGRYSNPSKSIEFKIGNNYDNYLHVLNTRLFDTHGFHSKKATQNLIKKLKVIQPDIVHLHNIHGYYLNIELLFTYLSSTKIPVVWTLHDSWAFTGHCTNFETISCNKWQTECYSCPQLNKYPSSFFKDNSKENFHKKKELFNNLENLTLVPVSNWLANLTKKSHLKNNRIQLIHNGIDQTKFEPKNSTLFNDKYNLKDKFVILGVAGVWNDSKGLNDFIQLSKRLTENEQIILVGLSAVQLKKLPNTIIGIEKTESIDELAELYTVADIYLNLTYEDTFPTTNLEALACGTPVITYNTGGSPEAIDKKTGFVVEQGDFLSLSEKIKIIKENNSNSYYENCISRAELLFKDIDCFNEYLNLYSELLN